LIPFLGLDASLCGSPKDRQWQPGQSDYLPSTSELAKYLAQGLAIPGNKQEDLPNVSQCVSLLEGTGPLYDKLHSVFSPGHPYTPTLVHRRLAALPGILREKGYPYPYQLILTTNYDDLLDHAFEDAGEPFDLVVYEAEGDNRGKFLHRPYRAREFKPINEGNQYSDVSTEQRTVILKIYGAVRDDPARDSYAVTEDHHIDYLTRAELATLFPVELLKKLSRSHFLFLGHSLRDWNLRVIFHRIQSQRKNYRSWAIQPAPTEMDERFWGTHQVDIFDKMSLEEYVEELYKQLQALPRAGGG